MKMETNTSTAALAAGSRASCCGGGSSLTAGQTRPFATSEELVADRHGADALQAAKDKSKGCCCRG